MSVVLTASSAWSEPRVLVDRAEVLVDTPLGIRLEGFAPRQRVTLTATMRDPWTAWQSRATFIADDGGAVDVASTAPASASYDGVSPMGLFWTMEPLPGERGSPPADAIMQPWPVTLHADAADGAHAEATLRRRLAAPGVSRRAIRESGVVGTLFRPAGEGRRPAVIVLAGSGGGVWEGRAALLASHGYAALALGYFRMPGLPQGSSTPPRPEPRESVTCTELYNPHIRA